MLTIVPIRIPRVIIPAGLILLSVADGWSAAAENRPPNIVFILADDLGYADVGCYGQKQIKTPHIDALAAEGMRFTQAYAGSSICAPSRGVLMTGQHTGHATVRGNICVRGGTVGYKGDQLIRRMHLTEKDVTVAQVLRPAGYRTGLVGKWHLDGYHPEAGPLERGFDEFYGWLTQNMATQIPSYFPAKRYRNRELYDVEGNQNGQRGTYETDMCTQEAITFIKSNKTKPFFLYLAYTNPHSPLIVPSLGRYADETWNEDNKTYAAMVTNLDEGIGQVMQTLKDEGLDKDTVVFFCSDNGPRSSDSRRYQDVAEFFDSNGPLRGYKMDFYEGGIRVPAIVRWPGKVAAGVTSDAVWYFADFLPTTAEIAGAKTPDAIDGISILPTLLGKPQETADRFLYWELLEKKFEQAVRWRNWKAVRYDMEKTFELYDLATDVGEQHDVAANHPEVVAHIDEYLKTARAESFEYPLD